MSQFTEYTIESAPAESRRFMTATRNHLGYLPAAMARMAASPQLLDGCGKLTAIFDRSATLANRLTGAHVDDELAAFA